jgi:hypothetical protein
MKTLKKETVTGRQCYSQAKATVYYKEDKLKRENNLSTEGALYTHYKHC